MSGVETARRFRGLRRLAPAVRSLLAFAIVSMAAPGLSGLGSPAAAAAVGTTVPGSDIAWLSRPAAEWSPKNQHRTWWNSYRSRWDGVLPGNGSRWWVAKGIEGSPAYAREVDSNGSVRPDAFWDDANRKLYVLRAGSTTRLNAYDYDAGSDTYVPVVTGAVVGGIPSPAAVVYRTPNGYLWASVMIPSGLLVNRSADGGKTWGNAVNLMIPNASGQTSLIHVTDGHGTRVAVAASEDGSAGNSRYRFFSIEQGASGWGSASSWTNESANLPSFEGSEHADDEISVTNDPAGNVYMVSETEPGSNSRGRLDPHVVLFKRAPGGSWSKAVVQRFGPISTDRKRPTVVVDASKSEIYIFSTIQSRTENSYIKAPLANLGALETAPWTLMFAGTEVRNNFVPRFPVDAGSDLPVLIDDLGVERILRNRVELAAGAPPANQPPSVEITAPEDGATYTAPATITIEASASDLDGSVTAVEFFRGSTLLGTDTSAPYSHTWQDVPAGSYSLTARATDNDGAKSTSSPVTVHVLSGSANQPPSASITSPPDGSSYTAPATIVIAASASDPDGAVTNVDFFEGARLLGSDDTSPYSHTWQDVPAGSYTLTARATDDDGATTTSLPVSVTVADPPGGGGEVPSLGLALWLRADQGVTRDASGVSVWADQSGNGRNAIQGSSAARPGFIASAVSGRPALSFDGSSDHLTFNLPVNGLTGMTIFLVAANTKDRSGGYSQAENAAIFWNKSASGGMVYLSPFQTSVKARFGTTQSGNRLSYARPLSIGSAFSITAATKDGTTDSLHVNGALALSEGGKLATIAGNRDAASIGRGDNDNTYYSGTIAEVLVYRRALSDTERLSVEAYLLTKYLVP